MSLAGFIVDQRTEFGVPHALTCRALGVASRGSTSGGTGHRPGGAAAGRAGRGGAAAFEASGGCTARRGCTLICARRAGRSA